MGGNIILLVMAEEKWEEADFPYCQLSTIAMCLKMEVQF